MLEHEKHRGERRGIDRRASRSEGAQARPLQSCKHKDERDERNEQGLRQQEKRREQRRYEDRGRAGARSELAFQATSARFAAWSCSLVRPKRRSRLR